MGNSQPTINDFFRRSGVDFESKYGTIMRFLSLAGFMKDTGRQIILTDNGSYWLHAFEDWFSIDFISKLWGDSKNIPWPEQAVLIEKDVSLLPETSFQ